MTNKLETIVSQPYLSVLPYKMEFEKTKDGEVKARFSGDMMTREEFEDVYDYFEGE